MSLSSLAGSEYPRYSLLELVRRVRGRESYLRSTRMSPATARHRIGRVWRLRAASRHFRPDIR